MLNSLDYCIHEAEVLFVDKTTKGGRAWLTTGLGYASPEDRVMIEFTDKTPLMEYQTVYLKTDHDGKISWTPKEPDRLPHTEIGEGLSPSTEKAKTEPEIIKEYVPPASILEALKSQDRKQHIWALDQPHSLECSDLDILYAVINLLNEDLQVKEKALEFIAHCTDSVFGFPTEDPSTENIKNWIDNKEEAQKSVFPKLVQMVQDTKEDGDLRAEALNIIKNFNSQDTIPVLLQATNDFNSLVREEALDSLGHYSINEMNEKNQAKLIRDALLRGLQDKDPSVRSSSLNAVRHFATENLDDPIKTLAVPILKELVAQGEEEPNLGKILDLLEDLKDDVI